MSDSLTFAFIDLAGFTALTEAHGDVIAAEQATRLVALAEASLAGATHLVKSIGDAVFLAGPFEADVVRSAAQLVAACAAEAQFPLARGGVHSGSAVRVGADYVGGGVNIAARVTARATGGQLVMTAPSAAAARALGLRVHELGAVELRGLSERLELFGVDIGVPEDVVVDPVCNMTVIRTRAAGMLTHAGHDYWFCSLECAATFATKPDRGMSAPPPDDGPGVANGTSSRSTPPT
jgi:adenylate cyclase